MLNGQANGCSQWFLSLRSLASGLEKPVLEGTCSIAFNNQAHQELEVVMFACGKLSTEHAILDIGNSV